MQPDAFSPLVAATPPWALAIRKIANLEIRSCWSTGLGWA